MVMVFHMLKLVVDPFGGVTFSVLWGNTEAFLNATWVMIARLLSSKGFFLHEKETFCE
jgi:hypothetical protein